MSTCLLSLYAYSWEARGPWEAERPEFPLQVQTRTRVERTISETPVLTLECGKSSGGPLMRLQRRVSSSQLLPLNFTAIRGEKTQDKTDFRGLFISNVHQCLTA